MSCTIFYKGTLKDYSDMSDVLEIVSKHIGKMEAEIVQTEPDIVVHFLQGKSESLVFDFKNKKIDSFWKWNGDNPEEFYQVLDLFLELQPLFKSLRIDDDEGVWHQYSAQKKPCKIKLRALTADERKVLERIEANNLNPPTELERFVMARTTLTPYYKALLRLIVQDFIEIMDMGSVDDFDPETIVNLAKRLDFMGEGGNYFSIESFDFYFSRILLQIWIGYMFEYKKLGPVKDLTSSVRGLTTSAIAAVYGIRSIFLNSHVGINNAKEAEMNKFAKQYYKTHAMGEVMVIDEPERELEMLFSMLDYLGFRYVGVNEIKEN